MFYNKNVKLYDRVVITSTIGITGAHRFFWGDPVIAIIWITLFSCGLATWYAGPIGAYTLIFLYSVSVLESLYWANKADPHPNWIIAYRVYRRYSLGSIAVALQRGGLESEELVWSEVKVVKGETISVMGVEAPRYFVYNDTVYEYYGQAPQKIEGHCLFDYLSEGIWVPSKIQV